MLTLGIAAVSFSVLRRTWWSADLRQRARSRPPRRPPPRQASPPCRSGLHAGSAFCRGPAAITASHGLVILGGAGLHVVSRLASGCTDGTVVDDPRGGHFSKGGGDQGRHLCDPALLSVRGRRHTEGRAVPACCGGGLGVGCTSPQASCAGARGLRLTAGTSGTARVPARTAPRRSPRARRTAARPPQTRRRGTGLTATT
ncbi:hypothetical protein SDC9_20578 [bioreactor metagenome]|uniref:Uncharacterized protein n=1 Tax=bioreactor metagenome TaxID=1076179 RepID=A0A644U753_9ZZZZ